MTETLKEMLAQDLKDLGPVEWAFDALLKVAAFGLAVNEHRDPLRLATLEAARQYRAANSKCLSCGHDPHEPEGEAWWRQCGVETARHPGVCGCSSTRAEDGSVRTVRR